MTDREAFVAQAQEWIGKNTEDGSHREIIDVYNSHLPLARDYQVKYSDAWCATFVSACAIQTGQTDIIPTECGCQKMIRLFKKIKSWDEHDDRIPSPGEIIFYDWEDTGLGNNRGHSDHVGVVEKVEDGIITVIEGNYKNAVGRRQIKINGRYIRGFGVPKFSDK